MRPTLGREPDDTSGGRAASSVESYCMDPRKVIREIRVLAYETIRLHEQRHGERAWQDEFDLWLKARLEQIETLAAHAEDEAEEYEPLLNIFRELERTYETRFERLSRQRQPSPID